MNVTLLQIIKATNDVTLIGEGRRAMGSAFETIDITQESLNKLYTHVEKSLFNLPPAGSQDEFQEYFGEMYSANQRAQDQKRLNSALETLNNIASSLGFSVPNDAI